MARTTRHDTTMARSQRPWVGRTKSDTSHLGAMKLARRTLWGFGPNNSQRTGWICGAECLGVWWMLGVGRGSGLRSGRTTRLLWRSWKYMSAATSARSELCLRTNGLFSEIDGLFSAGLQSCLEQTCGYRVDSILLHRRFSGAGWRRWSTRKPFKKACDSVPSDVRIGLAFSSYYQYYVSNDDPLNINNKSCYGNLA